MNHCVSCLQLHPAYMIESFLKRLVLLGQAVKLVSPSAS